MSLGFMLLLLIVGGPLLGVILSRLIGGSGDTGGTTLSMDAKGVVL